MDNIIYDSCYYGFYHLGASQISMLLLADCIFWLMLCRTKVDHLLVNVFVFSSLYSALVILGADSYSHFTLWFHFSAHLNHFLELYYQQNYSFVKVALMLGMHSSVKVFIVNPSGVCTHCQRRLNPFIRECRMFNFSLY